MKDIKKMIGSISKIALCLLLALVLSLAVVACDKGKDADGASTEEPSQGAEEAGLWKDATYKEDTTLGEGARTVTVKIEAEEKTVTLTVKTDEETLGAALFSLGLLNDASFFNVCNGMTADWDKDKAYWAFYVGDATTMAAYGVNDAKAVTAGEPTYRIVYTK